MEKIKRHSIPGLCLLIILDVLLARLVLDLDRPVITEPIISAMLEHAGKAFWPAKGTRRGHGGLDRVGIECP